MTQAPPNSPTARINQEREGCRYCDAPAPRGQLCERCIADEIASHDMDDEEFAPEGPAFECSGYHPDGGAFYCPLWGTEECDWECPYGGMG